MAKGERGLRVDHPGERFGDAVETRIINQHDGGGRLCGRHLLAHIRESQTVLKRRVVFKGREQVDQLGVEPLPPTVPHHLERTGRAALSSILAFAA